MLKSSLLFAETQHDFSLTSLVREASVAQCKDDQESFESSEADLAAAVVGLESAISKVTSKAAKLLRGIRGWEMDLT